MIECAHAARATGSLRRNVCSGSGGLKDLKVSFGTGLEVLNAYWGYLSDGGLVIEDRAELDVGDTVALDVHIESSRASYALAGKVVRRESRSGQAVIAFDPGQPHDLLLSEALAETDNVPARRHRRYRIELKARVRRISDGACSDALLINISREGCCAQLSAPDGGALSVGASLEIEAGAFVARGSVVWQRSLERGIRFTDDGDGDDSARNLLHQYLASLERPS